MKKLLYAFTITAFITACHSNPNTTGAAGTDNTKTIAVDTFGLAQFQEWKTQNELKDPNVSYNIIGHAAYDQVAAASNTAALKTMSTSTETNNKSTVSEKSTASSGTTTVPVTPAKKKGWSKAAKGTAIGAGTGAVLGAVIDKNNRVVGGVLGSVIGGGIGYGIGRSKDKKDGRN